MCLKLLFSYFKRILQAILSLTVLTNCISGSSYFDTAFCPDCTKFCSVFLGYWIENLIRIPNMCLILLFSYFKRILQAILSLTVFSNCNFVSSNFDTAFLPGCIKVCSDFLRFYDRKFNKNFENVLKTVIFLLQADFSGDCLFDSSNFDTAFLPDCTKFCSVFLGYRNGNLIKIPKMCLKLLFYYLKRNLQTILSLTVFLNSVSDSSNIDTAFLLDCTKFLMFF